MEYITLNDGNKIPAAAYRIPAKKKMLILFSAKNNSSTTTASTGFFGVKLRTESTVI